MTYRREKRKRNDLGPLDMTEQPKTGPWGFSERRRDDEGGEVEALLDDRTGAGEVIVIGNLQTKIRTLGGEKLGASVCQLGDDTCVRGS